MAGDWIPMRMDLHEDPAVIAIAVATGMDEYAVVGRLHKLWGWANKQLASGVASGVTSDWVDRYVSAAGFAAAMLDAGWLRTRSGGAIEFPNFERWNSGGAKKRLLNAQWMRNRRGGAESGEPNTTPAPPEKRREQKKKAPLPPSGGERSDPSWKELFAAVTEISGLDAKAGGAKIGSATALLLKAEPPYTPAEVREFGKRFWQLCPWAADKKRTRPTPHELATNIGLLRAGPANCGAPDREAKAAEIIAQRQREQAEAEAAKGNVEKLRAMLDAKNMFKPPE